MNINVISIFPEILESSFKGLTGKAIEKNIANLKSIDLKEFSNTDYGSVDDAPYGGGEGMVIGIVIGIIVVFNAKLSNNVKICMFISIALGVNYLYYILTPKSTYMLEHLSSVEQNVAWLGIYKEMKLRCHIGAVMGILGYILIGRGMCV